MSHLVYAPNTPFTAKDRYIQDYYVDSKRSDDLNRFSHEIFVPMRAWKRISKYACAEAQVERYLFDQPFDLRVQVSYKRRKEILRR